VDNPLVLENYRTAHKITLRQTRGASQHRRSPPSNDSLPDAFRGIGWRAGVGTCEGRVLNSTCTKAKRHWHFWSVASAGDTELGPWDNQSLREAEGQQELPVFEQKFYSRGNRNLVHQTSGIIILTKVVGRNRNFVI